MPWRGWSSAFASRRGRLRPAWARSPAASESTLHERWDAIEAQLGTIVAYVKQVESTSGTEERADPAFRWLRRTVRELDQYARALRWVLTVHGGDARS